MFINGYFTGEIKPTATIGGCISVYENAWPNPQQTIDRLEEECKIEDSGAYWRKAETWGQGAHSRARTNMTCDITHLAEIHNNPLLQNIHNQYRSLLMAASMPYAQTFGITEGLWHEGYSMLKYRDNQEYLGHYDSDTNGGRIISAICYLNDDYTGGELEFVNFDFKIKPKPGMLILFPSNFAYKHIAHPVTEGTKYGLVTWIKDREGNTNV